MKLRWSEHARSQIREVFTYIARDRPGAAERILEGFLERVAQLAEFPEKVGCLQLNRGFHLTGSAGSVLLAWSGHLGSWPGRGSERWISFR